MYYEDSLSSNKNNGKKTWEILKDAASMTKSNNKIGNIKNQEIKDPKIIANEYNTFL